MSLVRRLFFVAVVALLASGCERRSGAVTDAGTFDLADTWEEVNEPGEFSSRFPSMPKETDEPTVRGSNTTMRKYSAGSGASLYTLNHSELPHPSSPRDDDSIGRVLDETQSSLVGGFQARQNGKLLARREVSAGRFKGRELEIAVDKPPLRGKFFWRLFMVRDRLYQLSVFVPEGYKSEKEKFFLAFMPE